MGRECRAGTDRTRPCAALLAVLAIVVFVMPAQTNTQEGPFDGISETSPEANKDEEYAVPLEPLPKTITPCRACHGPEKDFKINWTREEVLRVHTDIRLKHGGVRVWCLDCHSPEERNYLLPLSDGKRIPFERSYELCGKCHGTKYRDWRNGIHGKRVGYWNGKKIYMLCTQCHNPHAPRFRPIEPMPPPKKPRSPKEVAKTH